MEESHNLDSSQSKSSTIDGGSPPDTNQPSHQTFRSFEETFAHIPMTDRTPEEYFDTLDKALKEGIKDGRSRYDSWWTDISQPITVDIRKRSEANDSLSLELKQVFIYWILASQLLETWYKYPSKYIKAGKKRKTQKQMGMIKKMTLSSKRFPLTKEENLSIKNIANLVFGGL